MKGFHVSGIALLFSLSVYSQQPGCDIRSFGADNQGKIKCTGIINQLIDSLSSTGGGTLYFSPGIYYTGPVILKSNITLYLDAGAVIKFSDDFDDYLPMVTTRWEDIRVKNFVSQFYAYRCENIAIRGDGHIEGNGAKWWNFWNQVKTGKTTDSKWQSLFRQENADLLRKNEYLAGKHGFLRPQMFLTYECRNILIEGVSFSNPPFWTIVPTFSDNITISGITIENPSDSPNTDGIDLSSCTNVHIQNCHISVGDDCIVIKSGRDDDGRDANKPTENITITNCTMLNGHGGVVIGSEMSGNVKRVAISNCVFEGTEVGIRIKTMRGRGGIVEDVRVSNTIMYNMLKEGIILTMRYQKTEPEPLSDRTPVVRDVHFSGISIRNANRAIAVYGLEEKDITGITFNDMNISSVMGVALEHAADIKFQNTELLTEKGFPFDASYTTGLFYDKVSVKKAAADSGIINIKNSTTVVVSNCYQPGSMPFFMRTDNKSSGLYFLDNIMPGCASLTNKKENITDQKSNILKP